MSLLLRVRARRGGLGAVILTLPLAVAVEIPEDSSVTQIRVAGGGGSYVAVMRDCEGTVVGKTRDSFADIAIAVDHKFAGTPLAVGASGGFLHDGRFPSNDGFYYVNGNFGFPWQRVGLSFGATYFTKEPIDPNDADFFVVEGDESSLWLPSLALRFGRPRGPYFSTQVLSSFPFYSGGGYTDMGIGGIVARRAAIWGGVNFDGLTASGIGGRIEWKMAPRWYLNADASFGLRDGDDEYGGALGVTYRVVH